jgi:hypothetical protein
VASLRARHSRACKLGRPWTAPTALEGCSCEPVYYVAIRDGGRLLWERAGKNRKDAQRALTKVQSQVDEGEYRAQRNIRFDAWSREWIKGLERKPSTVSSYEATMRLARASLGSKVVRRLSVSDIKRFVVEMRERKITDSTRAKHLRVLGICLQSALVHGYSGRNPVRELPKGERPRRARKEAAYFENDELPALFVKVDEGVYRTLFLTAQNGDASRRAARSHLERR